MNGESQLTMNRLPLFVPANTWPQKQPCRASDYGAYNIRRKERMPLEITTYRVGLEWFVPPCVCLMDFLRRGMNHPTALKDAQLAVKKPALVPHKNGPSS